MAKFAESTSVPVERSRAEIERTLARYGADQFIYGWDADHAVIAFRMHGRHVRFALPLPSRDDPAFANTPTGKKRTKAQAEAAWEQAGRQRWRALALVIKAKLEAVEAGITTFEMEFLAATLLPNGSTVGEWAAPQLAAAYQSGAMPPLLLPAPPANNTSEEAGK